MEFSPGLRFFPSVEPWRTCRLASVDLPLPSSLDRVGGVISGAITFMGLSKGSARLCRQLKCLPQANERIPGTGYYEKDEAAVAKKRIDVAEPLFIEKFGFTPMFYGSIVEYADRLEESLATGEAKLDAYNPDVLL